MMLPYIYTSFHEASQSGMPIWRSLAISYPFDAKIYDGRYQHQFTIGKGLMIAPVNSVQEFTKVYFPGNQPWYDLYSDAKYAPGTEDHVDAPLEKLPAFVQGGSIIPMQSIIQHTGEKSSDTLFVHVYAANTGITQQLVYQDDGKTYAYEKGAYSRMNVIYDANTQSITFEAPTGSYLSHHTVIAVLMHGFDEMGKGATINGSNFKVEKRSISFMKALSSFDPLGGPAQEGFMNVQAIHIPYPKSKMSIQW